MADIYLSDAEKTFLIHGVKVIVQRGSIQDDEYSHSVLFHRKTSEMMDARGKITDRWSSKWIS